MTVLSKGGIEGVMELSWKAKMILNSFLLSITHGRYSGNACRAWLAGLHSFMEVY